MVNFNREKQLIYVHQMLSEIRIICDMAKALVKFISYLASQNT